MAAVARLLALILAIQTAIFFVVLAVERGNLRKRARAEWEALEGTRIDWPTYLERETRHADRKLKRILILWVYILPLTVFFALVYFVNFA